MKECTKPDCNCIEIAEQKNGGNPVKNYPCLASVFDETELKSQQDNMNMENQNLIESLKRLVALSNPQNQSWIKTSCEVVGNIYQGAQLTSPRPRT